MRHTRCTDISIDTVDVDSLSDGGRNGSNKVRVYDIDRHSLFGFAQIYIYIYMYIYSSIYIYLYVMAGEQSIYMSRGGERQRLYAAESNWWKCARTAFRRARRSLQRRRR